MKLQPDHLDVQAISGYGPGWVAVGSEKITSSVVLGSHGERFEWHCSSFSLLDESHFSLIDELGPELVIFGSGERLRFPRPAWTASLASRRIGLETMDTQAACRTYNILAAEGRHVVLAVLLETM